MATQTLQPGRTPANPMVTAYLAARARYEQIDQSEGPGETVEARTAQFAEAGGRAYVTTWGIHDPEHAALVALLTADRLNRLIDGFSTRNDRDEKVITFGAEELFEVKQIKDALVNLWHHLDPYPRTRLQPLAFDLDLVNEHGHSVG